ncbi:MAG: sulfatase-like hydrolase/transferase [Actinomycetota bacterium]
MTADRPNVLFVITDQQRADHCGFMGNRVVRTPNLDAVADRGTVFTNAWVANPVCMPNRSSIMTGRLPTAHGVVFNDRSLDWQANTFVRRFRAAGYRTALVGKSHLQHGMSRNSVVSIERTGAAADPYREGWDQIEHFERYVDDPPPDPDDFYGFDHIQLAIDHGARVTGHHLRWALDNGGELDDLLVPYSAEAPGTDRSDGWWQLYRPPYDPSLHSTSFVTAKTIEFIDEASAQDRPWLAFASFPDPHHPMTPPGAWFDRHDPDDMELPSSIDDPMTHGLDHLRRIQGFTARDQRGWVSPFGTADHDVVRRAIALTYGLIEMVDDGVGRILAAIEANGQLDDTIVVLTSDHGDMMGEHGLMMKGFMPYRGTQQVPLAIADPNAGGGGARSESLACSVDLGPTLMDRCGIEDFDGIQGRSLGPILDDSSIAVRDHVLVEDDCPPALAAGRIPEKLRTVVTPSYRYTRASTGAELLFDTGADPDELDNLAVTDTALRGEAVEAMMTALLEADDLARGAPVA